MSHRNNDFRLIADLARVNAEDRPGKTAFLFEGQDTSYGDLDTASTRTAHALANAGVRSDDRVAYLGKNATVYFELLVAVAKAGAVLCPINWRLAPAEIAWILTDSTAEILFVGPEFVELARTLQQELQLRLVLETEGNYASWRDAAPAAALPSRMEDDPVLQMYTSGTTGKPKGAVLTSASILRTALDHDPVHAQDWERWHEDDVALVAMPCFHVGGTLYGVSVMRNGATGVIMREFAPLLVLDHIDKYAISKIFLVPSAIQFIVDQPNVREIDFSRLNNISYGASPIPVALLERAIDVFRCGFVQMYGMTETSGTIAALPPEAHDPAQPELMRSIGKPLRGVEMKVVGPRGEHLDAGNIGEIAIRTQANMREYWRRPDATSATVDADGWLLTGDAGYADADGYFYLHDRVKDMIISGGENVYPAEVENAIYDHPAVADVAVIGVPDERWGEAVKACVVLKGDADEDAIIAWARERIAAYKSPKSVDFVAVLPRNPSGKVLRRELRAPYWAGHDRQVA